MEDCPAWKTQAVILRFSVMFTLLYAIAWRRLELSRVQDLCLWKLTQSICSTVSIKAYALGLHKYTQLV